MNYFPLVLIRYCSARVATARWLLLCSVCVTACGAPASESDQTHDSMSYALHFLLTPDPAGKTVDVRLRLRQDHALLREIRFEVDPERVTGVRGDGELVRDGTALLWLPAKKGGELRWQVSLPNRRNDSGYDAWLNDQWGLFRAEDVIPRATSRTLKGASSTTTLEFKLPRHWSAVTEYASNGKLFAIDKPSRLFDLPSGWIVMGKLGVRRERISGVRVAVAAPAEQGVRRLDMLALMNWTLPELARVLPRLPPRLTIVSAGDPMWRGGLSAPQSIYLHSDRPLISENGTSTLLHEIIHVALGRSAEDGFDWIVEGLAEYYSLELLRRSGTLTPDRYDRAMAAQRKWSGSVSSLCASASKGARTAFAVTVFAALADEVSAGTDSKKSIDDVLDRMLQSKKKFSLALLREAATAVLGQKPDTLHIDKLPGCRSMQQATGSS